MLKRSERLQFRTGLASEWTASTYVLAEGEPGFESDTGFMKVGNGVDLWSSLSYVTVGASATGMVFGPGSSVDSNVVSWDGVGGDTVQDSGVAVSDVSAAVSHTSSDGSDHSFIDQSVVSGASPTFDGSNFTGVPVAGLADGTDGELITWDATGVAATVAVGTAGHVLMSNGAGSAPSFQDGGWVSLSTLQTETAAATDFADFQTRIAAL